MLNKVILMGRLTADPQMRTTPSGVSMCRFSVAVDRPFTSRETGQRETDFINVVVWRQSAEFVGRYFTKGSMIIVEGSLRTNNYTDQSGVKHYSMDVQADNVSFGETKRAREANQTGGGGFYPNSAPSYSAPSQPDMYSQPAQNNNYQSAPSRSSVPDSDPGLQLGDLGDFEEIISDGEVPF